MGVKLIILSTDFQAAEHLPFIRLKDLNTAQIIETYLVLQSSIQLHIVIDSVYVDIRYITTYAMTLYLSTHNNPLPNFRLL